MNKWLLGVGLLLWAGTTPANELSQDPVQFRASARVVVDEHGVPQEVDPSAKLPESIRDIVRQRVMQWRFEPLVVEGKPRTGATHVFLKACAVPQGDGQLNIAMNYSWHGPGYADGGFGAPPPPYPPEALRDGLQGSFRVILKVGPDGNAGIESIERIKGSLRTFERPLKAWVASLRYVPEQVDGVSVATRISIPVDFALVDVKSPQQDAQDQHARTLAASAACTAASQDASQATPIVLDSPFKPRNTG